MTRTLVAPRELDADARALVARFVTPRVALDGSLVFPLDEIDSDALAALLLQRARERAGAPEPPAPTAPTPSATPADPRAAYRARAASTPDPLDRTVARRQLARLERAARLGRDAAASVLPPSRWRHVPLGELFEQAGNRLRQRSNGLLEYGHEPVHGSKSGRCVLVDPTTGRWYCRSCRRGGDAIDALRSLRGWTYRQAAAWLAERYGPPAETAPKLQHKPHAWIEVRF
jgi:hypothetical protein